LDVAAAVGEAGWAVLFQVEGQNVGVADGVDLLGEMIIAVFAC